ncbi:unnamed protein product [Rhizophagus irregularis]|nr:unnamed protein product [Rhizophagus irregularis]
MRTSILRYSGEEESQTEPSNSDSDSDYDESMEQIHDELTSPSLSPFPFIFIFPFPLRPFVTKFLEQCPKWFVLHDFAHSLTIPFLWEDPFPIPIQHYHARLEGISRHIAIILLSSTLINRNRKEVAWLKAIKAINDVEDIKIFDDDFFSDELIDSNHPINARTERVPEGPRISVQTLDDLKEILRRNKVNGEDITSIKQFTPVMMIRHSNTVWRALS